MKSRKRIWIAALCLLSATVVTISLKARPASVHANAKKAAVTSAHVSGAISSSSVSHLSDAALRAAVVRNAIMLDDDGPMRVTGNMQNKEVIFPPVEAFTLTPPNPSQGLSKTILSVRFPEAQAAKLASSIPMTLAQQSVVLQRSSDDSSTFSAVLDFNWQRFVQEQTLRKIAASRGVTIPVFEGRRFVRREKVQFIEPSEIHNALQTHQPIQFSGDVLLGPDTFDGFNVFPDHQLMMTNIAVVQDNGQTLGPARTFDQCLAQLTPPQPAGNVDGPWTFNTLMLAIAGLTPGDNPQPAENMLLGMLNSFNQQLQNPNTNGFTVYPRLAMGQLNIPAVGQTGAGLLGNWPIDTTLQNPDTACTGLSGPTACPSLANAPVRLDAIVNRIDLGANGSPFPPAGELRFVFTVTTNTNFSSQNGAQPCQQAQATPMNIILEYNVPSPPSGFTALEWAQQWASLADLNASGSFSGTYLGDLQTMITDKVVLPNLCTDSNGHPISCIAQVRTNEVLLAGCLGSQCPVNQGFWEQREFHFSNTNGPTLFEATIAQTPDPQFNTTGVPACGTVNDPDGPVCDTTETFAAYINNHAFNPVFTGTGGAAPPVPSDYPPAGAFLGASALNGGSAGFAFWNGNGINSGGVFETARIDFSSNTCNGCHGKETATGFQHVAARGLVNNPPEAPSQLSAFLLGCSDGTCQSQGHTPCLLSTENLGEQLGQNNECPGTELVQDPVESTNSTSFGDIARRVVYLQTVCGGPTCAGGSGDDLLLPFTNKPIGVH